jgi:hypothetical protein
MDTSEHLYYKFSKLKNSSHETLRSPAPVITTDFALDKPEAGALHRRGIEI